LFYIQIWKLFGDYLKMRKALSVLNELKEKGLIKDYAIGGGIATLRWTEPFFTEDLDVFIVVEEKGEDSELIILTPIYEYLKNKGYLWKKQWIIIEDIPVDIFPADSLEREAVENASEIEYEGVYTKVFTPEYLIAIFLRVNREKDIMKARLLLSQVEMDLEKLKSILTRYGLYEKFENFRSKIEG